MTTHEGSELEWIGRTVAHIASNDDPEERHALEDAMFVHVLRAIAAGAPAPMALASAALAGYDEDAERWYA